MLRVGICDDEPLIIEALQRTILEIADTNGWEISISCFESGRALLEAVDTLEAVFLDIDMPELDGIETGKRIGE
ncbi:MAG: response regulator, partial [Lachnospiraceae bacterium]|nr:response regulator [Lachnospiraceae bacterium]